MTNMLRQPEIVLSCDGTGCLALPDKAPRVYVPAKASGAENHQYPAVTLMFPHLHYCERCWNATMRLDMLLDDKAKAILEARGRKIWPQGVKPDFDAALIEPVGVFTPEYERYMNRVGLKTDGLGYSLHRTLEKQRGKPGWL